MEDWGYEEYSDSERIDEMNCCEDYNRFEEQQIYNDYDAGEGREYEEEPVRILRDEIDRLRALILEGEKELECIRCGDNTAPYVVICEDCWKVIRQRLQEWEEMSQLVTLILDATCDYSETRLLRQYKGYKERMKDNER